MSPDPVAAVLAAYRSPTLPDAAVRFATTTVAAVEPPSGARARALCWACAALAAFGLSVGLEPVPAVLLTDAVIERFVATGTARLAPATTRTLRTNLRFVARRLSSPRPVPPALPRERSKRPYSAADIARYLAVIDAQPTPLRRLRAGALVALGAGAGLIGTDFRHVRGTDVEPSGGGVVVAVGGPRARRVPVLADYHERLLEAAAFFAARPLVGRDPSRRNVTTPLVSSLTGGRDLERLSTARLRATWLVTCAEVIGLSTFMACAGVSCSQRLGDLVATVAVADDEGAVSLLGAANR